MNTILTMCSASLAAAALALAISLLVYQRRLSVISLLLAIIGVLFLAGSAVRYAYELSIQPLPDSVQIEVYRVLDIERISESFTLAAQGFAFFIPGLRWLQKRRQPQPPTPPWATGLDAFYFLVGVIYLLLALNTLQRGFRWAW